MGNFGSSRRGVTEVPPGGVVCRLEVDLIYRHLSIDTGYRYCESVTGRTSKDEWTAKEGDVGVIGHSETIWKQTGGLSSIDDESDDVWQIAKVDESDDVWQIAKESVTWWYEDQAAATESHAGGTQD